MKSIDFIHALLGTLIGSLSLDYFKEQNNTPVFMTGAVAAIGGLWMMSLLKYRTKP